MIVRAIGIPLACHPYSSTSRIVHWLTRHHGKVSTLLKGALRPKSPFLGEYELFGTSELLYFCQRPNSLHTAKECAMLQSRGTFRTDWRAMQAASYLAALFDKTTPDESPHPGLFELFEELLDFAERHGSQPQFLFWAELKFCAYHGHAPNLGSCTICQAPDTPFFAAASGGVVCARCAKAERLPVLGNPPDVLAILRAWQNAAIPQAAVNTAISANQKTALDAIAAAFMFHHFDLPIELRHAAIST